jgi:hypothetical protein
VATFHVTAEDGREMLRANAKQTIRATAPWLVASLVVSALLARSAPAAATLVAGMGVAWLLSTIAAIRQANAAYTRVCRVYREPVRMTIDDDGLRTETEHGMSVVRRSMIVHTRALSKSFVVELATGQKAVLPRRHLSPEESAHLEAWVKGVTPGN